MSRFSGRDKLTDRVEAEPGQVIVPDSGFSVCRRKPAFRKWNKFFAPKIQPYVALALQPIPRNAPEPRIGAFERGIDHLIDRLAEARLGEAHSLRKLAEHLYVALRFAYRSDRLIGNLQIVVPIGLLNIFLLEESGRRQHDVGVIGGIGEELIVDDGEQIVTHESAHDIVGLARLLRD